MSHPSMPAPDFDGQSLPGLLRDLAARRAHQRAFSFVDYPDLGSTGRSRTLTWAQLRDRARGVAERLRATARPGDRAVLLLPQGLDYVAGFLGCLIAGVIAVPLFPPDQPGHENRVAAVIEDCEPACALVTEAGAAAATEHLEASGAYRVPLVQIDAAHAVQAGDEVQTGHVAQSAQSAQSVQSVHAGHAAHTAHASPASAEPTWEDPAPDDIAYLQYTSGSTRSPAGVMITHRNAVQNARQGLAALHAFAESTTVVSWLPLFHDMGLVMSVVSPLVGGFSSVLMDPVAFLARPERWLRLLGAYPDVVSAAPNFAYDYCVTKVRPEAIEDLRLDRVRALINGAEPVRPRTVRAFAAAFAANGLRPETLCPSYGLAEATVFVATDGPDAVASELVCERAALAEGRIAIATAASVTTADDDPATTTLVSCGRPVGQEVRIVDPASHTELSEDVVGEILVRGPNVGVGYWKHAEQSAEVFGAQLPGTGEQPWLRTGDLGAVHAGMLLVTGRLKDLLIIDGRNHYPQDVEETVQAALKADRRERAAVFAVPGEDGESVVAVVERRRDRIKRDTNAGMTATATATATAIAIATAASASPTASASGHGVSTEPADHIRHLVRARVAGTHGLRLDRLVLVPPGTIPRTSSGKVSRSACRAAYLRGEYAEGHR